MIDRQRETGPETGPGKQALGLFIGTFTAYAVGIALAAPFDLDVGAGHAMFHLVFGLGLGATALWLHRHQGRGGWVTRLALFTVSALALAQLAEGVVAIWDSEGDTALHGLPNAVSLFVLQPLLLITLIALVVSAARRRGQADPTEAMS